MSEYSGAHAADTEYFVRRGMTKGYERGRGARFTINQFLRATWIGGVVGIAAGGAFEYVRAAHAEERSVRARRLRTSYDASSIRADDNSTIGAIIFALMTPALFWKQANVVNLILGGAGVGSGVGLMSHWARTITGDRPPRVPDSEVAQP